MALITIQSKTISGFHWVNVTSGEVRVYADRDFTTSDGKLIQAGTPSGSDGFYISASFTVAGSTITIAQLTLDSTIDARVNSTARYNAYLFTSTGQLIAPFAPFNNFMLSNVWGGYDGACGGNTACTTWDAIAIYNKGAVNRPKDMQTYSRAEILAMLAAVSMQTFSFALPLRYNSGTNIISIDKATNSVDGYLAAADFTAFAAKASSFTVTGGGLTYGLNQIGLTQAGAGSLGYLTSTDWNTFNNKQGTIAVTGGGLTFDGTNVGLTQAGASSLGWLSSTDWNTFNNKQGTIGVSGGALTFNGTTVGLVAASTSTSGYLTSADWNTFNNKLTSYTPVAPIAIGSGNISISKADSVTNGYLAAADFASFAARDVVTTAAPPLVRSVGNQYSIPRASSSVDGYLAMGDWTIFNNKQGTVSATPPAFIAGNNITISKADTSTNGYLAFGDWNTFNNKQNTIGVTGGGLTFNGTNVGLTQASGSTLGWLSSTDWNTFNNKQATITVNGSSDLTFGSNQITLGRAGVATSGTLSSTDWNTFNNKQATISVAGTGYLSLTGATLDVIPNTHNQQIRVLNDAGALQGQSGSVAFKNATTAGHSWTFNDTGTVVEVTPTLTTLPASSAILVGTGRQILTDATLSGAGDLSADRTLGVVSNTSTQKVEVYWAGSLVGTRKRLNFTDSGILSVTDDGVDTITIQTTSSAGGAYNTVKTHGSAALTQRTVLNVTGGDALTAADNAGQTDITLGQSPSSSTSVVGVDRQVSTGLGLSGGGPLTGDLTLVVVPNSTIQKVECASNTALVGSGRKRLDFSTDFVIAEDALNDKYTVALTDRIADSQGSAASTSNTAAQTTVYSYSLPSGTITANGYVRVKAILELKNTNTTTAMIFQLFTYVNGVQVALSTPTNGLATTISVPGSASGTTMWVEVELLFFNQGTTALNSAHSTFLFGTTNETTTIQSSLPVKAYKPALNIDTAATTIPLRIDMKTATAAATASYGMRSAITEVRA